MVVGINSAKNTNFIDLYKHKNNLPVQNALSTSNISLPSKVTPDYNINIPQNYSKLPTLKLENGQEIHSYKLANGQKVMIAPMNVPTTYINTYVNVGSINENKYNRGISHLLEHLLFKDKNGDDKIRKTTDKLGGFSNGFTDFKQTYYTIKLPLFDDEDLETGIKTEADQIQNPNITKANLQKEKQIVKSEINMISDDETDLFINESFKTLYQQKEGTKDYISGNISDIDKISMEQIIDYHKKNYTPDNMTTVITGDINPEQTIKLVAKYFNQPPLKKQNALTDELKLPNKILRNDMFRHDNDINTLGIINFEGPDNKDIKQKIAFNILMDYMNNSENEVFQNIYTKLTPITNNKNMVSINTSSLDSNPEANLQYCLNMLNKFPIPTEEEFLLAKENIKADFYEKIEDPEIFNEIIGQNSFENLKKIQNHNKIIDALTTDDLKHTESKIFDTNKAAIVVVHPKNTTATEINKNYSTIHSNISFGSKKRVYNSQNIETTKLNNNIELGFYDKPNALNTNINVVIKPNKHIDSKIGVRELSNSILENLTPQVYGLNPNKQECSINAVDTIIIETSGITDKTNNMCDYILSVLNLDTEMDDDIIKNSKNILKNQIISDKEESKSHIINKICNLPNNETILKNIDNITTEDVKKYWCDILENSSITVVATGQKSKIKDSVIKTFNELENLKTNNKQLTNTYNDNKQVQIITKVSNNKQADISQAYSYKISGNIKDSVTFDLLEYITDKRLYETIREKEKLSYNQIALNDNLGNTGFFICSIKTDTDECKTNPEKAIKNTNNLINNLKNKEITDEELDIAKKYLKQEELEASYKQADITNTLLNGMTTPYGIDYSNKYLDAIDTISKQDIRKAANYIFNNKPMYSIVATNDTIEANKEFINSLKQS